MSVVGTEGSGFRTNRWCFGVEGLGLGVRSFVTVWSNRGVKVTQHRNSVVTFHSTFLCIHNR